MRSARFVGCSGRLRLAAGVRTRARGAGRGASQGEADEYTRYELLAPETSQFRIRYEVTATTPGATVFYNPIRKGSEASNEAVYDRLSAAPPGFEIVDGAKAKAEGYVEAELDTSYIKVHLPRPVPKAARSGC